MGRRNNKHPKFDPRLAPSGRQPRTVVDPEAWRTRKPKWSVRVLDIDGRWGWRGITPETLLNVLRRLMRTRTPRLAAAVALSG